MTGDADCAADYARPVVGGAAGAKNILTTCRGMHAVVNCRTGCRDHDFTLLMYGSKGAKVIMSK